VPARTASGRITSTGFPSDGASSWIPPELTKDQQRQILNRHDHSNTEIRQDVVTWLIPDIVNAFDTTAVGALVGYPCNFWAAQQ
jgi:hypothetical protein